MPDFKIVNPLDIPDWDNHVLQFPEATIFHSAAWARVLIESYGFIPYYCVTYQGKGIVGILPLMEVRDILGRKKGVSLPFTDFCEPLFNDQECFQKCFEHIAQIAQNQKWRFIEFRGGQQWLSDEPAYDTMYTHEIDLTPEPEAVFNSFSDTTRRNIRKAEKSGITVTHENSIEAVNSFYSLNCLTRREHGLPPQPWKFFKKLWETIIAKKMGFISLALYQQNPVAANFYMIFGKKALYKYGASDRRFQHLRPSNMAMWEGTRKCRAYGCNRLNLGRTEMRHSGLLQFKMGFGCRETIIRYFCFNCRKQTFQKSSNLAKSHNFSTLLFSRSPLSFLKLFGNQFYKYAG